MADATPVHVKKEPKRLPKPAPVVEPKEVPEVPHHPVVTPGNVYKLPDGTVVRDN